MAVWTGNFDMIHLPGNSQDDFTSPVKTQQTPLFHGGDQAMKSGSGFDAFDHLRASNASILTS